MHKKSPKICTGCRVSAAKIYLYHSTKIAKARPHRVECPTYSSVQKQWSMHICRLCVQTDARLICILKSDYEGVTWDFSRVPPEILLGLHQPKFFQGGNLKKKLCFILINQKKNQVTTLKKNLGRCYSKRISGGTRNKSQVTPSKSLFRVQIELRCSYFIKQNLELFFLNQFIILMIEPSCCKKQQNKSQPRNWFGK